MPSRAIESSAATIADDAAARGRSSRFYPLKIARVYEETRNAIVVVFDIPPELGEIFRFVQGQYVTLRARIRGEDVERSYSICSAVQDGFLRVGIKKATGGVFSNWAAENLKPGAIVQVMPPEGRFHTSLSPAAAKQYVAFAVGSGITPVLSIVKTTLLTEPRSRFTLFYGNREANTVMFREELAELKDMFLDRFGLIYVMTREHQDIDLLNGRITGERAQALLKHFCPPETIDYVFLCGPRAMVDDVVPKLNQLGIPDSRIKVELFTPAEPARGADRSAASAGIADECRVTIMADGTEYRFSMDKQEETILDAGLRRGIDLPHSCKSGICATCRAKLIAGEVHMDAHYALEQDEIDRGFILTCQSHPLTDEVEIDFDQSD